MAHHDKRSFDTLKSFLCAQIQAFKAQKVQTISLLQRESLGIHVTSD